MSIFNFIKSRSIIAITLSVAMSFAFVAIAVNGATTISTNISTGGTLSVTGLSTLSGGATTTTLTLLNGEIISNATDGVIQLDGIASTTSITLLNGETITNATDGTIALTGDMTVSGASTLTGLATFLGGATTTTLTLLNGEIISNATDGVIQLDGIASTTSITLLNGETITNATDGVITLTAATTSLSGALRLTGTTLGYNALATIGTVVTDTGADISANTGRAAGLQINLLSSGSTVTGFRGIDSRVIDSGTAASTVGVQGFATHLANVSTGELWGGNMIAKLTAGGVENLYGGVNEARVLAGAVGTGTHNYLTGGLNIYDVSGTATFGTETVKAASIGVLVGNNSNSSSKTKATGAYVAILGGDTVVVTGGAAFKVLNHSFSFPSKFDYGLDLYSAETGKTQNSFANADIRMNFGDEIHNTVASSTTMTGTLVVNRLVTPIQTIASATAFAINGASVVKPTGTNAITTITGGVAGQTLTLIFTTAIVFTDDNSETADTTNLSAAFTSADGDVLVLIFDGTSWKEVSRSVNG